MKKSNLFILACALLILGFFIGGNLLSGKYVSSSEFKRNKKESVKSLSTRTYNYKTVHFDEPFDEIIIRDTSDNRPDSPSKGRANEIQWVKSDQSGLKRVHYESYTANIKVEHNKLIIDTAPFSNMSGNKIILYSPTLSKIKVENAGFLILTDTENDSLEIESDFNTLEIAESTRLKKLTIQAKDKSNITVKAKSLDEGIYLLSTNSTVSSQIDSCNRLSIQGDSTSTVKISPLMEDRKSPHSLYNYLIYNDNIGAVVIENAIVNHIKGNTDKLTLNMTTKQIEETLRNVNAD